MALKKSTRPSTESSDLSRVDLHFRHHLWAFASLNLARLVSLVFLLIAIIFGALRWVFNIKDDIAVFGQDVDVELQLAFLGLFNKLMDLIITMSLENLAGVLLTINMLYVNCHCYIQVANASLQD